MNMPITGTAFLKRAQVIGRLRLALPEACVLFDAEDMRPYECDGLSAYRELPGVVALPENEEQVRHALRACFGLGVPGGRAGWGGGVRGAARGGGPGLGGGPLPMANGVLLSLSKMKRILAV